MLFQLVNPQAFAGALQVILELDLPPCSPTCGTNDVACCSTADLGGAFGRAVAVLVQEATHPRTANTTEGVDPSDPEGTAAELHVHLLSLAGTRPTLMGAMCAAVALDLAPIDSGTACG
jgi:hypothetical protein